jgi:hypothetical protein
MKKALLFFFIAFTFVSCEKANNGYKEVYAEMEVSSSGSNGQLDNAILEFSSQNPLIGGGVEAHGANSPMKGKSSVFSMPIGSNLTYNLYIMEGFQFRAWSDVTFKIVVGKKVKLLKKYKKGDINTIEGGNIIIE